jgi:hypothetical protein
MRYGLLVVVICFAIAGDLGVYIAMDDASFESFDPLRPATLLPIVAKHFCEHRPQVCEVLRDLADTLAAPYRGRPRRESPTDLLPE